MVMFAQRCKSWMKKCIVELGSREFDRFGGDLFVMRFEYCKNRCDRRRSHPRHGRNDFQTKSPHIFKKTQIEFAER